jgi:hypothetical protein
MCCLVASLQVIRSASILELTSSYAYSFVSLMNLALCFVCPPNAPTKSWSVIRSTGDNLYVHHVGDVLLAPASPSHPSDPQSLKTPDSLNVVKEFVANS